MGIKLKFKNINPGLLQGTFVCVFLFTGFFASGQDCSANLDRAKLNYREGKLYDIPGIMEGCLGNNKLSRQQQVEAYELLSLTYLYIDEPELAEESYLNLLRADPEYRPDSAVEVEIEFLSKNFKTTPIFTLYPAKIGSNLSIPRIINMNGTDNTTGSKQSYKPLWGLQIGGGADWQISNIWSIGGEAWFHVSQFRFINQFFDADSLQIDEQHWSLNVPIFLRYTHRINKWYPYAYAGYSFSYLINSTADPNFFEVTEVVNANGNVDRITNQDFGRSLNLTPITNHFNHNILAGLGVKYRFQYRYISFDLRYTLGLNNILNTKNQFDFGPGGEQNDIRELVFRYGQVDNDFRLDNLSINFGYVYPLYRPRKIEKKTKKGFINNVFKGKNKEESSN